MAVKNLCSCSSSRARQQQLLFFCLALSLHVPYHANSLSFSYNYSSFNPDDFRPEDDARVLDGRIELLGDEFAGRARGRAWHKQPVQLWDGTTGEAASFTANFSFSIQSVPGKGAASAGHGMTFFLAPYTPDLPQESYDGCLGLFDESEVPNYSRFNASGDSRFVAVEFDIHKDIWDPSSQHIGIDINNMDSRGDYTVLPDGSLVNAGVVFATVVYDNRTRGLDVTLMVGSATYTSVATVDLRSLTPEKVAVDFSAATGDEYAANHTVLVRLDVGNQEQHLHPCDLVHQEDHSTTQRRSGRRRVAGSPARRHRGGATSSAVKQKGQATIRRREANHRRRRLPRRRR